MSFDNFITESQLKQIIEEELASYQKEKIFGRAVALFNLKFPHRKDAKDWLRNKFSEDGVLDYKAISAWTRENRGKDPDAFGIDLDEKKKSKRKKAGTESSKETSLHHWFKRKGAKGKKRGWVDCNAPDGKGGYKSCGRSSGEKRKRYPSCRPTPGACKERGKGKSWGKKGSKRKSK